MGCECRLNESEVLDLRTNTSTVELSNLEPKMAMGKFIRRLAGARRVELLLSIRQPTGSGRVEFSQS